MKAEIYIKLTEEQLHLAKAENWLRSKTEGAAVFFEGNIRNSAGIREVLYIDFEAYNEMALKELQRIAESVATKFNLAKIYIEHRLGRVVPAESAVIIGVSAPHRENAFKACEELMHQLKSTVPIWKKEVYSDGHVWISAHP